jgi:sterol desaturase/sphingolipid hydroxylase (fatty acid hydroxylase superfamily)
MRRLSRFVASAAVSLSLVVTSTAAVASTAPPTTTASTNGWVTLSMLTPSGAAALGSTGVAAAQPDTPPPPPQNYDGQKWPPLPVILIWLAVLGVDLWILLKHNHHHNFPNSPP